MPARSSVLVRLSACALAVALATSACESRAELQQADSALVQALQTHIEILAHDSLGGRATGDSGYDRAAAYAARQFAATGLEPLGGDREGAEAFFQPVPLVRYRFDSREALIVRTSEGEDTIAPGATRFELVYPGTPPHSVAAAAPVFVGYGLHAPDLGWDDLAGLELEGRIAIVISGLPEPGGEPAIPRALRRRLGGAGAANMAKGRALLARGVAAILAVPDSLVLSDWDAAVAQRNLPVLASVPAGLERGVPPDVPVPMALLGPELIDRLFAGRPYHPLRGAGRYGTFRLDGIELGLRVTAVPEPLESPNVVGLVRGSDPELRDEYIVLSAHLDGQGIRNGEVLNSANDDASGSAAVMEIAAAVAAEPPRRSVIFAVFTGEESGHLGSVHFVGRPPVPLERIVADVNLEHYGRLESGNTCDATGPRSLRGAVRAADRATPGAQVTFREGHIRGADQYSFYLADIPALNIGCGWFPDYHGPGDDAERIDYALLARMTRLAEAVVRGIADEGLSE